MLINFKYTLMQTSKQFDFIIVGAGTAGCVIARRILDETNATVLLLEAGDGDPSSDVVTDPNKWFMTFGTDIDYRYSYAPQPFLNNRVIQAPRGKILGGSSSINGLIWARGNRSDYDGWATQGNDGWDYESVVPLFKRIEDWEGGESDYHGGGGPVHIEKVKAPNYLATALIDAAVSFGLPLMDDMSGPDPFGAESPGSEREGGEKKQRLHRLSATREASPEFDAADGGSGRPADPLRVLPARGFNIFRRERPMRLTRTARSSCAQVHSIAPGS